MADMTVAEMLQIWTKYILWPPDKNAFAFDELIDRTYGFLTSQTPEFVPTVDLTPS